MRFKLKIMINILIMFLLIEILEINAHNTNNGACKDYCSTNINKKDNEKKTNFIKNKKLIREQNSCVSNSLCRG